MRIIVIKEIIAYILLFFGVTIAIMGTVYYLRMYKAMIGNQKFIQQDEQDNSTNSDDKLQI